MNRCGYIGYTTQTRDTGAEQWIWLSFSKWEDFVKKIRGGDCLGGSGMGEGGSRVSASCNKIDGLAPCNNDMWVGLEVRRQ